MNCWYDSQSEGYSCEWSYLCFKNQTKDNHKTNMSQSEDLLSLTSLERKGLVPAGQGFLSHHSKYKYRVPTPSWMLHVCIIYSIRDYRFNSLVTAWECGVRFGQTSYIENQNRKIPFQITLDTQKKNSPLSWNPLGIKRIEPLSGCCFARSFAYPLIWLNQDQRKSRE